VRMLGTQQMNPLGRGTMCGVGTREVTSEYPQGVWWASASARPINSTTRGQKKAQQQVGAQGGASCE